MVVVAVVGAGAIGAFVGARILAGNEAGGDGALSDLRVALVGRASLLDAVREGGGKILTRTIDGAAAEHASDDRLVITEDIAQIKDADIVCVAVKAAHTEGVAGQLKELFAQGGGPRQRTVISLQNGVTNARILREVIDDPEVAVLAGSVVFNVVWAGNEFAQTSSGEIYVQDGPQADLFARLSTRGGVHVVVQPDITALQYGKLLINLNNAVNALAGIPIVEGFKDPAMRKVTALSIYEAIDVLKHANIPITSATKTSIYMLPRLFSLPDCLFRILMPFVIKIHPKAKTSMLQDLERGRTTEIDMLNGEIVRVAKEHGLPEPHINATLVRLVKEAEGHGSPSMDGPQLLALVSPPAKH